MIPGALVAAFLLAHGLIHAGYLTGRPPATASGPAWPFDLERSWLLTPRGVPARWLRPLGLGLVVATVAAFAVGALAALGVMPSLWSVAILLGALASLATLGIYFHRWLVIGIVIDLGLLWAVLFAGLQPGAILP